MCDLLALVLLFHGFANWSVRALRIENLIDSFRHIFVILFLLFLVFLLL